VVSSYLCPPKNSLHTLLWSLFNANQHIYLYVWLSPLEKI
jgi:hypothetical protein